MLYGFGDWLILWIGLERTPEWIGGCFSKLQSLAELSRMSTDM